MLGLYLLSFCLQHIPQHFSSGVLNYGKVWENTKRFKRMYIVIVAAVNLDVYTANTP